MFPFRKHSRVIANKAQRPSEKFSDSLKDLFQKDYPNMPVRFSKNSTAKPIR